MPRKPRSENRVGPPGKRIKELFRKDLALVIRHYWKAVDAGLHRGKGRPKAGQRTALQEAVLFAENTFFADNPDESWIDERYLKDYIRPIRKPDGTLNRTGSEYHKDADGNITVTLRAPSKLKPRVVGD